MAKTRLTIADIARELNLTAGTVSRALNDDPRISNSTKSAVNNLAKQLNYRKNNIASSLRLGRSRILGVIIPSAEITFFGSVIHGIEKIANENGYTILIYQSNELPEYEIRGIDTFLRSRVDGILASIAKETIDLEHYHEVRKKHTPLVLFDRTNDDLQVPSVVIDDFKGAFIATEHLVKQGCRRIAHIAGQQHSKIWNDRLKGYVAALKKYNLPVDEDLIAYGKVTVASGRSCMNNLMNLSNPPDALFAVEDFTALGALQALKDRGTKIPGEVAVVGFANEAFGEYVTPSLTTVDQQTARMGQEAAKLFFESAGEDFYGRQPPKKVVLEPLLICRQSSLKTQDMIGG